MISSQVGILIIENPKENIRKNQKKLQIMNKKFHLQGDFFAVSKLILLKKNSSNFAVKSFHTRVANIFLGILKLRVLYYI